MKNDPNCVCKVNGHVEANQIRAFLGAHGIPCDFRGESTAITHAFTLDGLGAVSICVPESMVEEAKQLLARAEAGELRLPDGIDIEPE